MLDLLGIAGMIAHAAGLLVVIGAEVYDALRSKGVPRRNH